jgi:hypothetical protein
MTMKLSTDVEMIIMLPLAALANKLQRFEAELRLLSVKASSFRNEPDGERSTGRIEAQLELIDEVLDSIKGLVSNLEADLNRAATHSEVTPRKPYPELDD